MMAKKKGVKRVRRAEYETSSSNADANEAGGDPGRPGLAKSGTPKAAAKTQGKRPPRVLSLPAAPPNDDLEENEVSPIPERTMDLSGAETGEEEEEEEEGELEEVEDSQSL